MPTPEEIKAAFAAKYGHLPSNPAEDLQAQQEAATAAAAPAVYDPGLGTSAPAAGGALAAPVQAAPASGVGWREPAAPVAPPSNPVADAIRKSVQDLPMTNADMAILQQIPTGAAAAGGKEYALVTTTQKQQQRTMLPESVKEALKRYEGYTNEAASAEALRGLEQSKADAAVAAAMADKANVLQQQNQQVNDLMTERDLRMQQLQADVDARRAEWSKVANSEYKDPRSGFAKAIGAVAAGLGAFGAALTHSDNWAQKELDRQFERDYDEWKRGIGAKRENLTLSQQILNETSNMYKDKLAAKQAARGMMLEQSAAAIEKAAYANKDDVTRAATLEQTQLMKAQAQQFIAQAHEREGVTVSVSKSDQPVAVGGSTGKEPTNMMEAAKARAEATQATQKAYGPQEIDYTRMDKTLDQVNGSLPLITQAQTLADMIDKFGIGDATTSITELRRQFQAMREPMTSGIIQAASGSGVSTEEYQRRVKNMFADDSISPANMKAALMAYAGELAKINRMKVQGVHPQLVEQAWQRIGNQMEDPSQLGALRAGKVPSRSQSAASGAALGGTNAR